MVVAMVRVLGAAGERKERDLESKRLKIKLALYNDSLNHVRVSFT